MHIHFWGRDCTLLKVTKPPQVPRVSEACQDIIRRMLVLNPDERISMSEIKRHPFFREGLPEGALGMNDHLLRNRPFLDRQVQA